VAQDQLFGNCSEGEISMASLDAAERKHIPASEFGMPKEKKYPMPDRAHAANAKSRASQAVNAGRMSKSTEDKIDRKANAVLGKNHKQVRGDSSKHEMKLRHS
jgi:hypothetical protein